MTDTTLPTPVSGRQFPSRAHKLADMAEVAVPKKPTVPSPEDRLQASRAHVRTALLDIAHPPPEAAGSGLGGKLLSVVRDIPGVTIVLETAKGWWKDHGQAARTAGHASQALLQPVAKRHPGSVVGAALAAGAMVIVLKPWRWLLRPKVLLALGSLVATQAIKGRSTGAWLQTVLRLVSKVKRTT